MTQNNADYINYKIRTLAMQLFLQAGIDGHDVDYEQAKREAAKLVALEEKKKKPAPPPSNSVGKGDVGTLLFQRIADMAARMKSSGRRPGPGDSLMARYIGRFVFGWEEEPQSSAPVVVVAPSPSVKDRIADVVHKLATAVGVQPEPTKSPDVSDEPASSYPLVYVSDGIRSAQLIPDEEFPATLTGSVTLNWRRSIEWNEQQRKRNRR